mmetsp:Transcript_9542/g.27204  ORF Transcript_9542/g.27204 Transcript_9542/m.27204 type:complete len:410 (-) Transcript_9542:163-1392(-)
MFKPLALAALLFNSGIIHHVDAVAQIPTDPACDAQCTGSFDMNECVIDSEKLLDKGGAVRWKDPRYVTGNTNFYAGAGDVGVKACRGNEIRMQYNYGGIPMPFTIEFDPATETLDATISANGGQKSLQKDVQALRDDPNCKTDHTTQSGVALPPSEWNGITFTIANRDKNGVSTGDIWITDVEVNGVKLGDFCGPASSGFNFQNYLPDYNMGTTKTTITGNLVLCGSKEEYDKDEYDKFEVLFLKSDTTRAAEGCGGGNDCPVDQVEVISVDNEDVVAGTSTSSFAETNPVRVISADEDTVTFEVCNKLAAGSVWTEVMKEFGTECYEHVQTSSGTNCQTYTAECMETNKMSVVDVYFENNGAGFPAVSDVPICCEAENSPKVTKLTLAVMCYCPSDEARTRNLLRAGN